MKAALIFASLALSATASSVERDFMDWARGHGKSYEAIEERRMRQGIWERNMAKINKHNNGNNTFTLAMNQFGDLTTQEFVKMYNTYQPSQKIQSEHVYQPKYTRIPTTKDWRQEGAVTGVKDQGQCGSCYSFSATGSLEGQMALVKGDLVPLSEQQIVDCSQREGNLGCNGGLMDSVFQYIQETGGLESESTYPYTARDGRCHARKNRFVATCTGFVDIPSGNEQALTEAIATVGPISVAIDASQFSFQFYSDGIYNEPYCSSSSLDHGVLAVGYGTDDGQDYYLVKNSWGESYGLGGYIKMSRNRENQCGIATQASYPLVN